MLSGIRFNEAKSVKILVVLAGVKIFNAINIVNGILAFRFDN